MSEFDDKEINKEINQENNNNSGRQSNPPQYSFWAEQMPNSAGHGASQGNSSYSNNNPYQNNPYGNNTDQAGRTGSYTNPSYNNYSQETGYNHNQGMGGNNYGGSNWNSAGMNSQNYYTAPQNNFTGNKKKKEHKVWRFLGKAVCFGLVAGLAFVGIAQLIRAVNPDAAAYIGSNKAATADANYEINYTEPGTVQTQSKSAISRIVDKTIPSIVSINCKSTQTADWFGQQFNQEVEGSGSGFIVGKNDKELLIATNNHVVEGATDITVTFIDETTATAVIKGTDVTADLAVISIDLSALKDSTLDAIAIAKLGNSDEVKVGEMVIAIGNALGYGQSVTVGYVSAKDREVDIQTDGYNTKKMVLLQTDAAINPGNSGGCLLDTNGNVIGINTVKYASDEVEGMGYAIPITKATSIINELMTREILAEKDQGYLGIIGNDVTEDVASYYNLPIGVFVNEVSEGGAAQKAGLLAGDVITKADSVEITSITQLRDYVTSKRVGTEVTVTYMRKTGSEYAEGTLKVTLGKNPTLNDSEETQE